MSIASISEKHHVGLTAFQRAFSQHLRALQPQALFGSLIPLKQRSDTIDRLVPEPLFQLLTNVMGTDLHAHEGGSADRSFLRYSLIKGILKGGITKLVIKPSATSDLRIIRLEDEYNKTTGALVAKSDIALLKEAPRTLEKLNGRYSDKGFYGLYITDENYLAQQLQKIKEHQNYAGEALKQYKFLEPVEYPSDTEFAQYQLIRTAEKFHAEQAQQLQGQLDRYALYKANEAWFWTDFLSTDSLKLYFRYYENLESLLKGNATQAVLDTDALDTSEGATTRDQLVEKLKKVSNYQEAVYQWANGNSLDDRTLGEVALKAAFTQARKNSLTDYRSTSAIINPAVKKLHVANLNAYNYLNRLAKENIRYAEYRVSLTGNDIGDPTNSTYYYDGQDKLWAVAAGLYGAKRNNARWGNPIDYGITVLLERQPKLTPEEQEKYKEFPNDITDKGGTVTRTADTPEVLAQKRLYKIKKSLIEADRVVKLAIDNKKAAIAINDEKRAKGDTNLDPRERITSIDLAGDEANFPADIFKKAFEKVHQFNEEMLAAKTPWHCLGITIHAGEEPFSSDANKRNYQWSQSIEKALAVGYKGPNENSKGKPVTPFRIGHGIMLWAAESQNGILRKEYAEYCQNPRKWADAVKNDRERIQRIVKATPLIDKLLNGNVGIELCPKSNVQTGSVPYYTVHPALFFLTLGLKVSVNTDNRTISNTDNANELIKLHRYLGLRWDELKQMIRNGAETAFIPTSEERDQVKADIEERFLKLERDPKTLLGIMLLDGYKPTHYQYLSSGNALSPIEKQINGIYPPIDSEDYRTRAEQAEAAQKVALIKAFNEQIKALKQPQSWAVTA